MKWSGTHSLVAGLALIAATNGAVLLGVAYNRSGEPESRLTLSARELAPSYDYSAGESSGAAVMLQWRVASPRLEDEPGQSPRSGGPTWLDEAKLASLGLVPPAQRSHAKRAMGMSRWTQALLVIELDGPAYRAELERSRERVARLEASSAANPADVELQRRAETSRRWLGNEESFASRLFVVDAGLEAESLRARYPDRSRYAIVHGRVGMRFWEADGQARIEGMIGLGGIELHVPPESRSILVRTTKPVARQDVGSAIRYEVIVAFGKRLEPWIQQVSAAKPPG